MRTWKDFLKSGFRLPVLGTKNVNPGMRLLNEVIYMRLTIRNQSKPIEKGDKEREMPLWVSNAWGDVHRGGLGKHQSVHPGSSVLRLCCRHYFLHLVYLQPVRENTTLDPLQRMPWPSTAPRQMERAEANLALGREPCTGKFLGGPIWQKWDHFSSQKM